MIDLKQCSLGIELGSTRIKAVLVGDTCKPVAQGDFTWENRLENGIWTYPLEEVWQGGAALHRCGMLNPNAEVNSSAAAPVIVLRHVRNGTSSLPAASNARYPCIIAETPMHPTVVSGWPHLASTSAANAA